MNLFITVTLTFDWPDTKNYFLLAFISFFWGGGRVFTKTKISSKKNKVVNNIDYDFHNNGNIIVFEDFLNYI